MMKFYYENADFKNIPNGNGTCKIDSLDINYGFKFPIFELNQTESIIWNFSFDGELLYSKLENNVNYFSNVFESVASKPNVKLVFSSFQEGNNMNDFVSKLIELKNKYKLKSNQVILITINNYFKKFTNEILVIAKPYLLGWWASEYKTLSLPNIFDTETQISTVTSGVNDYISNEKDSFFLLYNRNSKKTFRVQVMLWLLKTGLINNTKFSLLIKDNDIDLNLLISKKEELKDLWKFYSKYEDLPYTTIDWNYPNVINEPLSSKPNYSNTNFSIVLESSFNSESLNLTEKSFKPFANCHPFLIIGDVFTNTQLTNYGFTLYNDLIDYSFDIISDNEERLNRALIELKRIHSLGEAHITDWYKSNIEKIKENQRVFFTYSYKNLINDTIRDLKVISQTK
jgi:hypothetical protein